MTSHWHQMARLAFPVNASLEDVRNTGRVDEKRVGEHLCGSNFVYFATFSRKEGQFVRIFLRDALGIQNTGAGINGEERVYINEVCLK